MKIYTIQEAADEIKMSVGWIRQAIRDGELDIVKFGRSIRIRELELAAYVERKIEGNAQLLQRLNREFEKNPLTPIQEVTRHVTR